MVYELSGTARDFHGADVAVVATNGRFSAHPRRRQTGHPSLGGHDLSCRATWGDTIYDVLHLDPPERAGEVLEPLYAQPLTRVVRLTVDDVIHGDPVLLRLGEPPSPAAGPFADLLLAWADSRDNMKTATNRDSRWLFPVHRAGQPMNPTPSPR